MEDSINTITEYLRTRSRLIIVILLVITILLFLLFAVLNQDKDGSMNEIIPTGTVTEPIAIPSPPVFTYAPYPTLPPAVAADLAYPINYDNIIIMFKPKSGTFLIYYQTDEAEARATFEQFAAELSIPASAYRQEYGLMSPPTLPPAYGQLGENPN